LPAAIQRICDVVGWKFRVNLDRTLDFASAFNGAVTTVTFAEGVRLVSVDSSVDYTAIANRIRTKGSGIYSTKQDGTYILTQGLIEAPNYQTSVTDQAMLDGICQAAVDKAKLAAATITVEAVDDYDPGSYRPEDFITITDANTGLSGSYRVKRIGRKLEAPNIVTLDLENRVTELWQVDETLRRMVKDVQ
jgi:hypothetical protein